MMMSQKMPSFLAAKSTSIFPHFIYRAYTRGRTRTRTQRQTNTQRETPLDLVMRAVGVPSRPRDLAGGPFCRVGGAFRRRNATKGGSNWKTSNRIASFLQRDADIAAKSTTRRDGTTTTSPGLASVEDDGEDDDVGTRTREQLSKLKVADLKLELEKRNLKKYGKKQELVDRLLVELKRERKSAMMTFVNDDDNENVHTRSRENSSNRNNGEGANEDDDDNASRVNGFDGERDVEEEDMTAVNAAPPPSRPPSPQPRVQRAKVRRRVVRRGSGAVDATASSSKKVVKRKSSALKSKRGSQVVNGSGEGGSSVTAMMPSSSPSSHIVAPKYNPSREAREKQNEREFVEDFEKAFKTLRERLKLERLKASSDPETKLARMFEENKMQEDSNNRASGSSSTITTTTTSSSSSSSSDNDGSNTNEEKASDRLRRLFTERRQRGMRAVKRSFNQGEDKTKLDAMTTMSANIVDVEKTKLRSSDSKKQDGLKELMHNADVRDALDEIGYALEANNRVLEGYNDSTHGLANNSIDPFKLVAGEYVVHRKYGIGKFLGMRSINHEDGETGRNEGIRKVFLFIQFADDTAKIEPKKASMQLYRYASPGAQVKPPRLSKLYDKLGSWEAKEAQMQKQIRDLVVHQMCVYLQRLQCVRAPYKVPEPNEEAKFAEGFRFELTPDQKIAIEDINEDMTRDTPMDRIIVGDVGFGKTEVAFRAMSRACFSGKNSFILAPTTVLAKQHAANVAARFRHLGVEVNLLTRHVKAKEQKEILESFIKRDSGKPQIIVGTHGLLNLPTEVYDDLDLLIIDEEQRFGVRHKDQISALKATVDVLTLSATPIPRTLHMAVSGFRDASLVQTPPPERRPIRTNLLPMDEDKIREAIEYEINRGGQIYYIVPRIMMMGESRKRLFGILPNLRVIEAHGQMDGDTLDAVMDEFSNGEADVLLCTTIVESGLDIPNCNTIIIEEVQSFGLASLYQLRGRVGRADRQAHAWMFYGQDPESLNEKAKERLLALEESCGLGEGFKLAERDMSIRGVGTLFGEKQSGEVDSVGADLYLELLYSQLQRVEMMRLKACLPGEVKIIHKMLVLDDKNPDIEDDIMLVTTEVRESTDDLSISPAYIAMDKARRTAENIVFKAKTAREFSVASHCLLKHFGEVTDSFTSCALLEREIAYAAAELGVKEIIAVSSDVKNRAGYIDCIIDLPVEVKDMLVTGMDERFQGDVLTTDDGIRILGKKKESQSKADILLLAVMSLRRISEGVPAFVKYL
jgi:transcription-repair coupling factor